MKVTASRRFINLNCLCFSCISLFTISARPCSASLDLLWFRRPRHFLCYYVSVPSEALFRLLVFVLYFRSYLVKSNCLILTAEGESLYFRHTFKLFRFPLHRCPLLISSFFFSSSSLPLHLFFFIFSFFIPSSLALLLYLLFFISSSSSLLPLSLLHLSFISSSSSFPSSSLPSS